MTLQNDLLLRTARGELTERVPVWMMRQAGRVLPQYRAVRERAGSFITLAKTPELAAEVTIQPVDAFDVDAAIIFSDILVVPEAMGLPYEMIESRGPGFPLNGTKSGRPEPVARCRCRKRSGLCARCHQTDEERTEQSGAAHWFCRSAPFTIFCYMTEGKGSKTFSVAKKLLYTDPNFAHALLQQITDSTIAYLQAQIRAGVDLVQIFDSWAGILSPEQYRTFSLPYIKQICDLITDVPVTVFAKGAFFARHEIGQLSCDVVGLDWNMDPKESRELIPDRVLQGNLDPCVLYADFAQIRAEVKQMFSDFGHQHYIANLGHGIYPDTDPDKARCFVDAVKEM